MKLSSAFPYVHSDRDRHGNVRRYYRRRVGEQKIRLKAKLGTPEFAAEYAAAHDRATRLMMDTTIPNKPKAGTLRWLCVQYLGSTEFQQLEIPTQQTRRRIIESCLAERIAPEAEETFADFPIQRMTSRAIRVLRDRKAKFPSAATGRVKSMRRLFSWALERDLIAHDPTRDVKRLKHASTGYHAWTTAEVTLFEARHAVGTKARLAMSLLMYTGVRRSDVVLLGRQHVQGKWLKFTAHKNRNRNPVVVEIPILPALAAIIEQSRTGNLTFLVTEYGKPFTAAGFGGWFRDQCDAAQLPQCSAHGLRKAGAECAAENGATAHELMAIFGWLSLKEAERYCQGAERRRLARNATRLLDRTRDEG